MLFIGIKFIGIVLLQKVLNHSYSLYIFHITFTQQKKSCRSDSLIFADFYAHNENMELNAHGSSLFKCIGEIEENKALQPNAIKLTCVVWIQVNTTFLGLPARIK